VIGHAVEEAQLQQAEPQHGQDRRVERLDGALGEHRREVVERRPALHGPVGQRGGEGALPSLQPGPARLGPQRPVGVGAVLEGPAQDGVRHLAGGGRRHRRWPRR
jgi:hypothetical protein